MELSVCILTHDQPELLPHCVGACISEIAKAQIAAEIIIIDNASSDAYSAKLAGRSPLIRVIRNEQNLGFSAANNVAIRSTTGRYILILNDDAVLGPGSLALMLRQLESDLEVGAVGPKLLNPDGTRQDHFTNRRFPHVRGIVLSLLALESSLADRPFWRDRLTLDRDPERSGDTDQIAGACLLLRRLALDGVGLFDEGFHYWFEDTDLCYRVKRAGWRIVYMANASVVHHGSASLNRIDESERAEMFIKSLMYFFRKNRGLLATVGLRISLALVILYRAAWIVAHRPVAGVHQREASCGALRACLGMVRVVFGGSG